MGCQTSLYDHRRLTGAYKQVGGWHEGNHSATLVKADSGCCPAQSFDLCSMLESYDFDNLFLFLDPVIN